MFLKTKRLVIRDLERKDEEQLFKIVWQKNVVRYMRDWSDNNPRPESFHKFIDWRQSQKDSKDIYENKRYAVALKDIDLLVGVVGMGIEENLNEIEMAYEYRRNGSGRECITVCPGIVEAWSRFGVPYVSQRMSWAVTCK